MHVYRDSVIVDAPVEEVFAFYTEIRNLARMLPPALGMRVVKAQVPLRKGAKVRFGIRPGGFPIEVTWDSIISEFEPHKIFEDRQLRGPFDHWVHRHEFRALAGDRTEIIDTIEVGSPMGMFGKLLESVFLTQKIYQLFDHRRKILRDALEKNPRRSPEPAGKDSGG